VVGVNEGKAFEMRTTIFIPIAALAAALLVAAPAALAGNDRDREVIRTGNCSRATDWKLKAKLDDGRLEVEFEVDQNRVGRRWRVTIVQNGRRVFSGIRRTLAPSGSFEARRLLANRPGADRIVANARALAGGETCRGAFTF
jgi:hypothetical protein